MPPRRPIREAPLRWLVFTAVAYGALQGPPSPAAESAAAVPDRPVPGQPADCAAEPVELAREGAQLEVFRVRTGLDGKSYGELVEIEGSGTTYLGALLMQFDLGDPSKVVVVRGPAGFRIPMHPAPYRELFLVLSGSSTAVLSGGQRHVLRPGSLILFEDTTGEGHGGFVGPCGYVALDLQFKPPDAAVAPDAPAASPIPSSLAASAAAQSR